MALKENEYALALPINSLRAITELYSQNKLDDRCAIQAIAHAKAVETFREYDQNLDAYHIITAQPTINFSGKVWWSLSQFLGYAEQKGCIDVPLNVLETILPSSYDGENHKIMFARLNPHKPLFQTISADGGQPFAKLWKLHLKFRERLKQTLGKEIFRKIKASVMVMVDVNPGREEMKFEEFVVGLKQPFMRKVHAIAGLWECLDYQVF